jgi:hypothetical protein
MSGAVRTRSAFPQKAIGTTAQYDGIARHACYYFATFVILRRQESTFVLLFTAPRLLLMCMYQYKWS